jgi:hypothetical protein
LLLELCSVWIFSCSGEIVFFAHVDTVIPPFLTKAQSRGLMIAV